MSCNGCRVLRKGCSENCILRESLQAIHTPQAQANATVFVAKFFGRAGLISFLSSVPPSQRPALFQSLLFEACGRTVNPVSGAVGLLWTGNWKLCLSAVETLLRGGVLRAMPEFSRINNQSPDFDDDDLYGSGDLNRMLKRKAEVVDEVSGLDLGLTAGFQGRMTAGGRVKRRSQKQRLASPTDESETTTLESGFAYHENLQHHHRGHEPELLRLFF